MAGCRDCKHSHWQYDARVCDLKPHDHQTAEQIAIVKWLREMFKDGDRAFTSPGCPSYRHWKETK